MLRLPLLLLFSLLTTLVAQASPVVTPSVLIQNYSVDDYKASCQNMALSVSNNGILYIANNSGLLTFDGNTWRLFRLPDNSILTGITFFDNKIYTCTEAGEYGYWTTDNQKQSFYHPVEKLPEEVRFSQPPETYPLPQEILQANPTAYATIGDIHITGTETNGLYITNPEGKIALHLHHKNQLPDNYVRAICVQDEKLIWVAFDNGLSQIALNPPIVLLEERGVIGKLQQASLEGDWLYIETNRGCYKQQLGAGSKFAPITTEEALPHLAQTEERAGNLTVGELFKNTESLGTFAHASSVYPCSDNLYWLRCKNEAALFHRENGRGSMKCRILFDNYNMNLVTRGKAIFPLNENLYLVSAMQGILLVNTRQLIEQSLGNPSIKFSSADYTNQQETHDLPLDAGATVSLPYNFKEINVYVGTSVFTPNHQISYKLEGVTPDWSEWQQDGKISFLQLPEGTYELKVRKYVIKGPFPELSLLIEVRPPWYNSLWAYIGYTLLIWLLVQQGLHYYLKGLRKEEEDRQKAEQQAEQQKRHQRKRELLEAELQDKNNELTLQTSALVKKNQAMQSMLEELDKQKETLGERYPNKMYTRLRSLMEATLNDQESWALFENYFNTAHRSFIERLRQEHTDITAGDLRICCFLRMNLSTKEIASLLNVSIRAVEIRRYRLRKRLGLDGETNLVDFLMKY